MAGDRRFLCLNDSDRRVVCRPCAADRRGDEMGLCRMHAMCAFRRLLLRCDFAAQHNRRPLESLAMDRAAASPCRSRRRMAAPTSVDQYACAHASGSSIVPHKQDDGAQNAFAREWSIPLRSSRDWSSALLCFWPSRPTAKAALRSRTPILRNLQPNKTCQRLSTNNRFVAPNASNR